MNVSTPPTGCDACDNHQPDIYSAVNATTPLLDLHRVLHDNARALFTPILNWLEKTLTRRK